MRGAVVYLKNSYACVAFAVLRLLLLLSLLCSGSLPALASYSVEIDLQEQRAYLLLNRRVVLETPISSGRSGFHTNTGNFKITQKSPNHLSSLYGKIVDANGETIVADADSDMPVPPGGRFVSAPMPYFMRFNGGEGMHAGYLPGYPASHGCVRLPKENAIAFYRAVEVGTPVAVFGRTPRRQSRDTEDGWQRSERREVEREPLYERPRRRSWSPFGWW